MNEFEQDMYNYFTSKENYRYMNDLCDLREKINEKLIKDFWVSTFQELEKRLKPRGFSVEKDLERKEPYAYKIFLKEYKDIWICLDEDYDFGIYREEDRFVEDSNELIENIINNPKYSLNPKYVLSGVNDKVACYIGLDDYYRFDDNNKLAMILPETRDGIINTLVKWFEDNIKIMLPICGEINKLERKK